MNIVINAQTGEKTFVQETAEELARYEAERAEYTSTVLPKLMRDERNKRLAETDYLALSDATLTDEMRAYRQALRDLPANTADPANPVWPVKPGGDF